MLYAVSAWFDEAAEQEIRKIWKAVHEQRIESTFHLGPYRPHITLALFEAQNITQFSKQLRSTPLPTHKFQLEVSSLGFFNHPSVIFFNCAHSQPLCVLHSGVNSVLETLSIDPPDYYHPGKWTPHISLTPALSKEKLLACIAFLHTMTLPFAAQVNRLGIIEEDSKTELEEIYLEGETAST
jgi:2'-5' RNA ligase